MAVITRKGLKEAALPGMVVMFVVRLIWTAVYIGSGQYALDRRIDQWIK